MEKLSHQMIGRIISVLDPQMVQEIIDQYAPITTDITIVPKVFDAVVDLFPDMKHYDSMIMFINVVYKIFTPQSFLPSTHYTHRGYARPQGKLPAGVRIQIKECLNLPHEESVNSYKHQGEPFTKNPRYQAKMQLVLDELGLTAKHQNHESSTDA